ncbi:MAG: hypothetical protein QNJ60_15470 [Xenococcaceae cyanobacterium MO_188.B19]|nr:hypothetical protein [Xenococcaceae cyanobacterium MO_188.B19]
MLYAIKKNIYVTYILAIAKFLKSNRRKVNDKENVDNAIADISLQRNHYLLVDETPSGQSF